MVSLYEPAPLLRKPQLFGNTHDSALMDSIVFYQPQLATAPKFNEKLVLPLATIPRNNARSALLQNGEWNTSRRDQGWLTYPDATDLCWRGQPRLGHQADGDNPLVDQGASKACYRNSSNSA